MIKKFLVALVPLLFSVTSVSGQNANANVSIGEGIRPIPAKSTIRGRVFYGDTGRAVRRASVMLMREDRAGGPGELTGLTDSEGYFQIKNVAAGTYYPMINAPGVVSPMAFADFSRKEEREALDGAFVEFEKIVVNGITDVDVQISAKRGGALSGRVTYEDGDPAIGVKIEILRKDGEEFVPIIPNLSAILSMFGGGGSGQTDDRGAYRYSGLPRGEYKIKVTENISHTDARPGEGYSFMAALAGTGSFVSIYYPDVRDVEKAQVINVELGSEQVEINVVLPNSRLRRLEGKVITLKEKTPLERATVYLKRQGETTPSMFGDLAALLHQTTTDEQGKWSFKDLPDGTYDLTVEPPVDNDLADLDPELYGSNTAIRPANTASASRSNRRPAPKYAKKIQEITIDDQDLAEIIVEVGFGATLSGTVSADNGRDLPEMVDVLVVNENEHSGRSRSAAIRPAMPRVPGMTPSPPKPANTFLLQNVTAGRAYMYVISPDDAYYVKSATIDGRDLLSAPFELKEGETLKNIQIVVGTDVGGLKGKVIDADKVPVRNAQFTLVPTDAAKRTNVSFYRNVATDEKGEFTIEAAPQEYSVVFGFSKYAAARHYGKYKKWLEQAVKTAQKITIKAKESSTLTITLPG